MKYKDCPLWASSRRHKAWTEVEPIRSSCYSETAIDLQFEYTKGADQRRIMLELDREEAEHLRQQLVEFLEDKRWNEFR